MKQIALRAIIAIIAFALGIASAALWLSRRPATRIPSATTSECVPVYDPTIVVKKIREDDDPQFFAAFQEPPLNAMPDCVDEAYSLTWIPSFHPPVLVRVWRSGSKAFMVAKELDSKGWSKFGNLKETNARPITAFEWRDFTNLLNRSSYWEVPSTIDEIVPNDGAAWLVDGLRGKQYHWVRRRVPNEQYAEICKHFIRLSGLASNTSLDGFDFYETETIISSNLPREDHLSCFLDSSFWYGHFGNVPGRL